MIKSINVIFRDALQHDPDSKLHGANMGPTWVLLAPDGPHVGPMNLAIRGVKDVIFLSGTYPTLDALLYKYSVHN